MSLRKRGVSMIYLTLQFLLNVFPPLQDSLNNYMHCYLELLLLFNGLSSFVAFVRASSDEK